MRIIKQKPEDKRVFTCPQCNKHRMTRPVAHVVSREQTEFKTRDGSPISLFTDICDGCAGKNYRKYFEPTRSDVRKVLKAMNEEAQASGDVSLEDLL